MQDQDKNIAGSIRERVEQIVRKHFREMPDDEACRMKPEDYELPSDEEEKSPE